METEDNYAPVLDRMKSTTIDTIILIACFYLSSDIINSIGNVPDTVKILLFITFLMYEPVFVSINGTFGNYRNSIRVRKNKNTSEKLNIIQSLIRYFFKISLGWISLIFILMNHKGRALHDIISGSVMIKIEE
ncbi:RDD family protein [Flavobacterium sp. NRK F10]|uniref:RDD family protein n=1 Tax=Flavobacterium sp. NRK F10 TaxID=2954931 RepID=UPI002090E45C|nr:RDD family protein [Flavobacterium sp. NRK F10]MCO6176401.1 RDD family protein [Flavobacterium sp. NRK F10]